MEAEYLVKWQGKAHVHNEWVNEAFCLRFAKRKLINFKRRFGAEPCLQMEPEWKIPQRFIARRPSPCGPGWEVLVKWTGLGYENATWEVSLTTTFPICHGHRLLLSFSFQRKSLSSVFSASEATQILSESFHKIVMQNRELTLDFTKLQAEGEGVLVMPSYLNLHRDLWRRQHTALLRASSEAIAAADEARPGFAAGEHLPGLLKQPEWVTGGTLHAHQLQSVNWMRRQWAQNLPALLADEIGLGKTASAIAFLQCLRSASLSWASFPAPVSVLNQVF